VHPDFLWAGDSVFVIMDRETGAPNKVHEISFFGNVGVIEISDITYFSSEINYDPERWRQILKLTLDINCKLNILRVVAILNRIEGIHIAEPNHYGGTT
jgi:hypothetical protein